MESSIDYFLKAQEDPGHLKCKGLPVYLNTQKIF